VQYRLERSRNDAFNKCTEKRGKAFHLVPIFCPVGYLGGHKLAEKDFSEVHRIVHTNYLGIVSLLNLAAMEFEMNRAGLIVCDSPKKPGFGKNPDICRQLFMECP
jgi:hypothetical protein